MAKKLDYEALKAIMAGDAVAIRGNATLVPAGGPGDKVFPPSHSVTRNGPGAKYAMEKRRIGGAQVDCVLLDSVQSQANRMEEALQALWADKRIPLPVISVDLSQVAPDVGVVTSLTAPHRIADALLRDSLIDGKLFRMTELGKSFIDASVRDATALFKVCPTGLLFGIWDSTGPKGGLGAKFARAVVSEIVGIGVSAGVKTASRIDPTGIVTKAADIYQARDPEEGWTYEPQKARKEGTKPVKVGDGRVSEVNHSNIPPSIDEVAGGVTMEYATHTAVLSLAALRKLGFGAHNREARTALAALGLLAILAADSRGHDLRSRCLLVPEEGKHLRLELVNRNGKVESLELDLGAAVALYDEAVQALPRSLGAEFKRGEPFASLSPSPKLEHLIVQSRKLAAAGSEIEE